MVKKYFVLMMIMPLLSFAQTTISGKVTSNDGALPGVNVVEKNTGNGTISDIDGNYSITVKPNAVLVFSYIGFQTKEVNIGSGLIVNVAMEENAAQLDEVVVKGFGGVMGQARRRAESVQSIPESVVTFTSEQIEATGVNNLQSFAGQVPNVAFSTSQNVGVNFVTVRGIPQIRNGDAPIAFVIDGVTIPDANLLNQELFDLALMEVVKGPQGALYGKNAIAGAINVVTKKPTNSFVNRLTVGYANGNTFKAQAAFSGPIAKDKVYYRLSGSYKNSDGLFYNITNGTEPDFYDDINFRGQLFFNITNKFKATISGQYSDIDSGALYYFIPPNGEQLVSPNSIDDLSAESDFLGSAFIKNFFGYLKLEYDFGGSKLQTVTSFNDSKRNVFGDLDHTSTPSLLQYQDSNSDVFNQEIRLGSTNSEAKIAWDIGAFYQKNSRLLYTEALLADNTLLLSSDFTNKYITFAVFGFVDYKLTDNLTLSAGLRYDNDNIKQDNRTLEDNFEKTDSEFQPKFSISYKPLEGVLLYGNYGRGYRVGGFNGSQTEIFDAEYRAETSDNYEMGLKSEWWNDRFILNMAVFFTDLKNQQQYGLQLDPPDIVLGNYNYNKSKISGFEADMKLRLASYLDILAGFGTTSAEIEDGGMAGNTDRTHLKGVNTPFVPQTSFSVALQSNFPLSENVSFNAFANLQGKGKIYWHEEIFDTSSGDPLPQIYSPGYSVLDLRLGVSFKKKLDITLWGSNILDERYAQEFYSSQATGGPGQDLVWYGRPATVGVDLTYKF